jgi:hypothetical protein
MVGERKTRLQGIEVGNIVSEQLRHTCFLCGTSMKPVMNSAASHAALFGFIQGCLRLVGVQFNETHFGGDFAHETRGITGDILKAKSSAGQR